MLNITLNELKQIAKMRRIKGCNNMSKERLLCVLDESESIDNTKIRKIKEDFNELRDMFLEPKIKEIRENLYEIENKNLSESKTKEIEKNLLELYYDYDDVEYKRIRGV